MTVAACDTSAVHGPGVRVSVSDEDEPRENGAVPVVTGTPTVRVRDDEVRLNGAVPVVVVGI